MKLLSTLIGSALLFSATGAIGQVTISSADMFNELGLFYRAYANASGSTTSVADLIGEKGGPHLWDFSEGPTDQIFRFDYLDPSGTIVGVDFPEVKLAERKTEEANGNVDWLLFNQEENVGRKVFGFWTLEMENSSNVFSNPIIDFPNEIDFGDQWSTGTSYENTILGIPALFTHTSTFEVDAWGFIELPELGFGDVLRVNELVKVDIAADINSTGTFTALDQQFIRNYYFLRPGHGIAAQMTSRQSGNPPSEKFNLAAFFVRMFETNKKPIPGCEEPSPVADLQLSLQGDRALLKWSSAKCAKSYQVEYLDGALSSGTWRMLGETESEFFLDETIGAAPFRLYRVVSRR